MLNGYSGFKPASFYENVDALRSFPDEGVDCAPANARA